MSKDVLIVMMKNPVLGKAKTRLAKATNNEFALEVYLDLLQRTKEVVHDFEGDLHIYYSDEIAAEDHWPARSITKFVQHGKDLGERMLNALENAFHNGADNAVVIGADCYEMSNAHLKRAIAALKENDVVVGPSKDGGYYLIGMKKAIPELFSNMPWGTSEVLSITESKTRHLEKTFTSLDALNDIDTLDDLKNNKALFLRYNNRITELI